MQNANWVHRFAFCIFYKEVDMKRIALLMIAALLLTGCTASVPEAETILPETMAAETTISETEAATTAPTETEPQEKRYLLTFTGDCTFGSNPTNRYALYSFENTVGENWSYPFANVVSYFESDDCTFVNLEGTLTETGTRMPKAHNFKGSPDYVNILTDNSVDAVTLANNHTIDYGPEGYANTTATLDAAGIPYVEENASTVITLEDGFTIGLYGTVYYSLDVDHMVSEITAMKDAGVDLIIFAPHWGAEGYYKPNNIQTGAGHAAIDAGAHIVWGSHPHVLQPIESYNGGILYYSLGNFSFGGNMYPDDYDTALIQQEVIRYPDGTVALGETTVVPCCLTSEKGHNNFQPTPYEQGSESYARVLKKLGLSD